LSRHLSKESTEFALDESYNELYDAEKAQHPPVSLVNMMMNRILHLHRENKISGEQMIFLDKQLSGFLEVCGGCERIKIRQFRFLILHLSKNLFSLMS
jgi:putative membrane protein